MKKCFVTVVSLICSLAILFSLASCGGKADENDRTETDVTETQQPQIIDYKELINKLDNTEKDLGLVDKYNKFADVTDGELDSDLAGLWLSADSKTRYDFGSDGVLKTKTDYYGSVFDNEIKYTCLKNDGFSVLCVETETVTHNEDGTEESTPTLAYDSYLIDGDVLYMMSVESAEGMGTSYSAALQILYRADNSGSAAASVAANPMDLRSLYGVWSSEKGDVTVDDNGMNAGGKIYKLSFNNQGKLTADDGETATAYGFTIVSYKEYSDPDKSSVVSKKLNISLTYMGKNADDVPNLKPFLDDWHEDYKDSGYEDYYFTQNFTLAS